MTDTESKIANLSSPKRKAETKRDYWEDRDRIITEKYLDGCSKDDILVQTGFPASIIEKVIKNYGLQKVIDAREKKIAKDLLKEKIPVLRDIIDLSLQHTRAFLEELNDPEIRAVRLRTIRDVKDLTQLAHGMNELLRLELGQATQNIRHDVQFSLDETKKVFSELKKVDKVFDYPVIELEPLEDERTIEWQRLDDNETNS